MNDKEERRPSERAASAYDWMSSLISALVVVAVVFTFLFRVVSVSGKSMTDTLQDNDRLMLITSYDELRFGDIIVIRREDEEPLIKRVIAVAGDTISFNDDTGLVTLNGEQLHEDYVRGGLTPSFGFEGEYTVPDGYVFAMGDNRPESKDSRMLGAFPITSVMGIAKWRLWPLNGFGPIYEKN